MLIGLGIHTTFHAVTGWMRTKHALPVRTPLTFLPSCRLSPLPVRACRIPYPDKSPAKCFRCVIYDSWRGEQQLQLPARRRAQTLCAESPAAHSFSNS